MSLRALHKNRGVGAVIALIGMAFYAMLFPWHTVSQTYLQLAQAGAGTTTIPSCHREATGEPAKPAQPVKQTHCPICSGLAALQLALTSPRSLFLYRLSSSASFCTARRPISPKPRCSHRTTAVRLHYLSDLSSALIPLSVKAIAAS